MGIKFLCPNGHKLNVKTFLAGKRAICPKCQARVTVPMPSAGADNEAAGGSTILTAEDMAAAGAPLGAPTSAASAATALSPGAATATAAHIPVPVRLAEPIPDPIAEVPSAVWYVRPASGGQFGPASGDIMRGWIQEGRVGASSLVWRAGWSDWRPAASTFPQLAALAAPPGGSVAIAPAVSSANGMSLVPAGELGIATSVPLADRGPSTAIPETLAPLVPPVRRRQNQTDANVMASGVLVVIILILVVVLAVVFLRKDSSAENETPEVAPAQDSMAK